MPTLSCRRHIGKREDPADKVGSSPWTNARANARKYSTTHVKLDIGDVKGTSAIERQSNVHSYKRGMFEHCFWQRLLISVHFEKLWCSSRAFALVFGIVFYSRIMATCSPSQERQLVLMESMNRRLDSFLASQKKLEEKNATLQQENVKLRTELSKQEQTRLKT